MDSIFPPRIEPEIENVAHAVDQLANMCDRLQQKLTETEDALVATRREYATWVIGALAIYEDHADRGPLYRPQLGISDPEVFELVRKYENHYIDTCSVCGKLAPVLAQDMKRCAWGCSVRPLSIAPPP